MGKHVRSVVKALAIALCLPGVLVGFVLILPGLLLLICIEDQKQGAGDVEH